MAIVHFDMNESECNQRRGEKNAGRERSRRRTNTASIDGRFGMPSHKEALVEVALQANQSGTAHIHGVERDLTRQPSLDDTPPAQTSSWARFDGSMS